MNPGNDSAPSTPILILVAGPNGSGKTTLTEALLRHEWLVGCHYINPDNLAQDMYGGWNNPESVRKAAEHATELRHNFLREDQSMALETVFSTPEKIEFVKAAKASGFFVRLFFIATDSPDINAGRVAKRVIKGGHDVPIRKIISRHPKSIGNLAKALPIVDRAYVFDNSVEDADPALQLRAVDGAVQKVYATDHAWINRVLESLPQPLATAKPGSKETAAPATLEPGR